MTRRAVVLTADPGTGDLLALWLRRAGYEVAVVARGGDAARLLDEDGADLVVTDRIHPHWSGLGSFQAIKRRHPGVRVMVAGPRPDDPFLPLARAIGADAVFPAPLDRVGIESYV